MNRHGNQKLLTFAFSFAVGLGFALSSFNAASEDIDIFSVDLDQTVNTPNVLIILDNSANWSRQSQQWPGGLQQGQSEVRAIKEVISELEDNSVNVGLMLHRTEGAAADTDNGYVRYHIRPMNSTNKPDLQNILYGTGDLPIASSIFANINDPIEKRSQSNPQGHLMWDAYNYFAGIDSAAPSTGLGDGTPASKADSAAYDSQYSNFRSPLASTDTCTRTIIIYIGNNRQGTLREDSAENKSTLQGLGGDVSQIPFAEYEVTTTTQTASLGHSNACYSSLSNCTTAENLLCTDPANDAFDSCQCTDGSGTATSADDPIACITERFTVFGRSTTRTFNSSNSPGTTTRESTGEATKCQNNDPNPLSCPSSSTVTVAGPGANQEKDIITSWNNCAYEEQENACGRNDNKSLWTPTGDKTVVEEIYDLSITDTDLGPADSCTIDAASCDPSTKPNCGSTPNATYDSCFCAAPSDTSGCPVSGNRYEVSGTFTSTEAIPTGNFTNPPAGDFMADEWARFMRGVGVPLPGGVTNTQVTTYTIDVFNAQQSADFSGLLFNMARVGGGKYFQAKNEDQIKVALQEIFTEIQAVNTAFSSASLPVNATNRAQNENQVFIGLFRPDRQKQPLWFGNLKRYQLIQSGPNIELGDKNGNPAINEQTGFITDCAVSFWTTPSGDYWLDVTYESPPAVGQCGTATGDENSDLPDGPFVEKGAVAEVLRKGNGTSADGNGHFSVSRNIETLSGGSLVDFTAGNSGGFFDPNDSNDVNTVNFIRGEDLFDRHPNGNQTEPRPTIHGDVVHSRPQPVNYGGDTGVVVFYGANDGTFRGVRASDGRELWSFVAPEHFSKLARLKNNSPNIKFSGDSAPSVPKDYFFDGTIGIYQTFDADNEAETVYIFPSMRRGGRKIYAFDVSNPNSPSFLWSFGCPNQVGDDTGCEPNDLAVEDIGQTWSQPNGAFIKGYNSGNDPVIVVGGGYDPCEDADTPSPSCAGAKGSGVYVIDATTGSLIKHFDFGARSVAANVALLDVNQDGLVDYGFAADTGGNIYRMDFVDGADNFTALGPLSWTSDRIAYTSDASNPRKFLFAPTLFRASPDIVYLAIGSGDREQPLFTDYPRDSAAGGPVVNRFYVVKNKLTEVVPLTEIDLDNTTPDADGKNHMMDFSDPESLISAGETTCDVDGVLPTSNAAGWFMDLDDHGDGEQVVTSAAIAAGSVIFSTNRATLPSDTACTNSLGVALGYNVNLFNASGGLGVSGNCGGDQSAEFIGGGLPPSPVIATVPVGDEVHTVIIGAPQKDGTPSASIEAQKVTLAVPQTRRPVYWFKTGDTD